ncbi:MULTISPECIES: RIP metalloprotease [Brevibacterium]|uniref:Membrane-associated protease RseP, regulator of RpoE activity n=1 Tax=Brevibacterium antiquum CNRZ 918 TaxID=1255637 RepID=A0A2H1JEH9_9MICO|nr:MULTISPECIES: site-2 protease family protein [Brevibacterium]SMX85849.1 Membrane-associated protease RseP, regulator of RpoE activity [Brevibacterium antiquum CNRZ 918]HCG57248.1 PDZ domain-containing protein [Brevibacterium sp.]
MTVVLYIVGIVLFLIGISISIGLHELGHLTPAKRFGVKVTHYMVGFGPTVFSFRRGETEYGIKALPLGGFIAMPGMYPPLTATTRRADTASGGDALHAEDAVGDDHLGDGTAEGNTGADVVTEAPRPRKQRRGRLFENTMADARDFSNQEIEPGEEHRTFYALNVPKRLVVMFSGPLVNLVLGIIIMAISLIGIGIMTPTTTVQTVVECAVPASEAAQRPADQKKSCQDDDPLTPAWEAGIKPGDDITSVAGVSTDSWDELSGVIKEHAGERVDVEFTRDGRSQSVNVPIIAHESVRVDDSGRPVMNADGTPQTVTEGFFGVGPVQERQPLPLNEFPGAVWEQVSGVFHAIVTLPVKLIDIAEVATGSKERDAEGLVGMVGVGRIAGEIVSTDKFQIMEKAQLGLGMLGSLNIFLFAFNMIPLLPLDGGHIAVGLYEGARRQINKFRGRGRIGPFDTARLLPLTYVVIGLMLCMTALLVYVDLVKPVTLDAIFNSG